MSNDTLDNDFKNLSVNRSKKRKSPNTVTQLEAKRSRLSYTVFPVKPTIELDQIAISQRKITYKGKNPIHEKQLFQNIWQVVFPDGRALVKKSNERECDIIDMLNTLRHRLKPLRQNVCNFVFGKRLGNKMIVMESMDGDFLQLYERHIASLDLDVIFNTVIMVCKNCICLKKKTGRLYTDVKSENILYRIRGSSLEICLGDYDGLSNGEESMFTYPFPGYVPDKQVRDINVIWPLFIMLLEGVLLLNNIDHTYIVNVSNIYSNTPQMKEHMKDMEDILYQLDGIYWDVWNTLLDAQAYTLTLSDFLRILQIMQDYYKIYT